MSVFVTEEKAVVTVADDTTAVITTVPSVQTVEIGIAGPQGPPGSSGGPVGGVLSGNLPNPDFAVDMATQSELDTEAAARIAGDALLAPLAGAIFTGDVAFRSGRPFFDARAFGVVGDNVADDTAALQAMVDAIPDSGGIGFIPYGMTPKVSAPIVKGGAGRTITSVKIIGAGKFTTVIKPTAAFGSQAVFRFMNARDCFLEDLGVDGNATTPVQAAVEFRCDTPGTISPSRSGVRNCKFGGAAAASLGYGVRYTAATDQNNDFGVFDDADVINFTQAAYSFEHSNSLMHRITGGVISNGPTAVRLAGGSFDMAGTVLINLAGSYEFDFQAGTYYHQSSIKALVEWNLGTSTASGIIKTDTSANVKVAFAEYERKGSTDTLTVIDFNSVNGYIEFVGCDLNLAHASQTAQFTNAGSEVRFAHSNLGITDYIWNGKRVSMGNHHYPGTVTDTPGANALFYQDGDSGGGYNGTKRQQLSSSSVVTIGLGPTTQPGLKLGTPSTGQDTNLYRSKANQLTTDDQFVAADGVATKTISGAGRTTVQDSDFTVVPSDGQIAAVKDTTTGKVRCGVRFGGVWFHVEVS